MTVPDEYKGVPVPPKLRRYWRNATGKWWRIGVDAAQEAAERRATP